MKPIARQPSAAWTSLSNASEFVFNLPAANSSLSWALMVESTTALAIDFFKSSHSRNVRVEFRINTFILPEIPAIVSCHGVLESLSLAGLCGGAELFFEVA
jgi:hypothetical protein